MELGPGERGHADVEVRIESLAAGGEGVGHLPDGLVVFVPFSAPGDLLRVRLVETRARFARARILEILEAGPARVDPVCPAFGSCGGCAWQHIGYAAQLDAKREILVEALRRIGGLEPTVAAVLPSPSEYAYRGRTRVRVACGKVGYLRRRSHALCAVSRCPVLVPDLERVLRELASHPPSEQGEWELAIGSGEARAAPVGTGAAARIQPEEGARIQLEVGGRRVGISPGVFAQSNALLLDELAAQVEESAGTGSLAVELFAGAGFLTVGLAARFGRIVAVEGDPAAVRDLRANLAEAGLGHVEVVGERIERALPRLAGLAPDALVLDPPRSGLPRGSLRDLAAVRAARIAYLSCDPATLARDLADLCAHGYGVRAVLGIDLFPQTAHVEALATLERGPGSALSGPPAEAHSAGAPRELS